MDYKTTNYLGISRIMSYVEQYKYVNNGDRILEFGNGGGVFQDLVEKVAFCDVVDIDPLTEPDYVIDIRDWNALKSFQGKYNKVFCCQVLEHIPFCDVKCALSNIFKLQADIVCISIPDNMRYIKIKIELTNRINFEKVVTVPWTGRERNLNNHSYHHWELWYKNKKEIIRMFESFDEYLLIKEYRLLYRAYQHFFIFAKNKDN